MFLKVFTKFLVGRDQASRDGLLRSLEVKFPSQLLETQVGSILVKNSILYESLIGDCKREFAVFRLGINNPVKIVAASRLQLKSQVLNLH